MTSLIANVWDSVRSSFWFHPTLFCVTAVGLSFLLPALESSKHAFSIPEWIRTTPEAARSILSTTATIVIGVTGTVFSITVVVLSLASQQFGPRLVRTFMDDLGTQIALGVFTSTGLYALLILSRVDDMPEEAWHLNLAVFIAIILAAISLFVLIGFIHLIAVRIQAPEVIRRVTEDLNLALDRLYPEAAESEDSRTEGNLEVSTLDTEIEVIAKKEGYIQAINHEGLVHYAREKEIFISLLRKPGDFITNGSLIAQCSHKKDLEKISESVSSFFIVGHTRTPRQDFECAISELVEVAVRALSPGTNDPFTTINCIDRLGGVLVRLSRRPYPSNLLRDSEGNARVAIKQSEFPAVLDAAFNQIRQNASYHVSVIIRLLEALEVIGAVVERAEDVEAVRRHAELVSRAVEKVADESDREDIQERLGRLKEVLHA